MSWKNLLKWGKVCFSSQLYTQSLTAGKSRQQVSEAALLIMPVTRGEQWMQTAAEFSFATYAVQHLRPIVQLTMNIFSHLSQRNEGIILYTNPEALLPGES